MKKIINWVKKIFKKEEPKVEINPKIEQMKDLISRIANKDKQTETEVSSNDIPVFDVNQHKVVYIGGERKKKIVKKVQEELGKKPELFTGELPIEGDALITNVTDKKILDLPNGEQKVVKKKKHYKSTPKKKK